MRVKAGKNCLVIITSKQCSCANALAQFRKECAQHSARFKTKRAQHMPFSWRARIVSENIWRLIYVHLLQLFYTAENNAEENALIFIQDTTF